MSELYSKMHEARREYLKNGSIKLNAAKAKLEEIILPKIKNGEISFSISISLFDLGQSERVSFENWLVENGLIFKKHFDQRDGDYYYLELKDKQHV